MNIFVFYFISIFFFFFFFFVKIELDNPVLTVVNKKKIMIRNILYGCVHEYQGFPPINRKRKKHCLQCSGFSFSVCHFVFINRCFTFVFFFFIFFFFNLLKKGFPLLLALWQMFEHQVEEWVKPSHPQLAAALNEEQQLILSSIYDRPGLRHLLHKVLFFFLFYFFFFLRLFFPFFLVFLAFSLFLSIYRVRSRTAQRTRAHYINTDTHDAWYVIYI